MEQYELQLDITEEEREQGHDLAEEMLEQLIIKVNNGELTHQVFTGFLWEMMDLCDQIIEKIAE